MTRPPTAHGCPECPNSTGALGDRSHTEGRGAAVPPVPHCLYRRNVGAAPNHIGSARRPFPFPPRVPRVPRVEGALDWRTHFHTSGRSCSESTPSDRSVRCGSDDAMNLTENVRTA